MNLFHLVEDIEWSPWKSCIQSDGNLCRCQVRPCQNKQNHSCEGGYEFRLENCTGEQVLCGGGGGEAPGQKGRGVRPASQTPFPIYVSVTSAILRTLFMTWGPFLEALGNLTGPESDFDKSHEK